VKALACIAPVLGLLGSARADDRTTGLDPSYLVDGGAVPLFWVPLAAQISLTHWATPRSTPLLFDPTEGGATRAQWEVPDWALIAGGAGAALAIGLGHDRSRSYHVKGLAESMATAGLVVAVMKPLFGRHRPDWSLTSGDTTKDESFPSGHSTEAFAIATYGALYLHDHVLDGTPLLEQGLIYGGVFTAAGLVDAERVYHHRHFVSDVVAGSLLGSVTSTVIYRYQQHRANNERARDLVLTPSFDGRSTVFSVAGSF